MNMKKWLLLLLVTNYSAWGIDPDLAQLSSQTQKIIDLLVKDSIDPQIQIETDKLRLLRYIQKIDDTQVQCDFSLQDTPKELKHWNLQDSFTITSNNPLLSKLGIDLVHLRRIRSRTVFAKGKLNGEEVLFKLHINKMGAVNLSYIHNDPLHIPVTPLVPDISPPEKPKLANRNQVKGNSVISTFYNAEDGRERIIFTGSDDGAALKLKLDNKNETVNFALDGRASEIQDEELHAQITLQDKAKENIVYGATSLAENKEPELGYRYRGEKLRVDLKHNQTGFQGKSNAQLKIGETHLKNQIVINSTQVATQTQLKRGSKSKKTTLSANINTVNDKMTQAQVSLDQKIGRADIGIKLLQDQGLESAEVSTKASLGERTQIKSDLVLTSSDGTSFNSEITHHFKPAKSHSDQKKSRYTASALVVIKETGNSQLSSTLAFDKKLGSDNKSHLKLLSSVELNSQAPTRYRGRADFIRALDDQGKLSLYLEGTVSSSGQDQQELKAGVSYKKELGQFDPQVELVKIHKLYRVIKQSEQHIGYYLTWRYECDHKKKKLRIRKQKKPFFGKIPLNHLFAYAVPLSIPIPEEIQSPVDIDLSSFCK